MSRLLVLISALALAVPLGAAPAHASVTRNRQGSSSDVSRTSWPGPAFVLNGAGAVVSATMAKAINAVRGGAGTLDVVVIAGSGSTTPECNVIMGLSGVNSCTTLTMTAAADGNNAQANTDIRNAEFVYFAGGDQCRYASWKGTSLEASVESVVAKGGGSGGGSAGHHINSDIVYDACTGSVTSAQALSNPYHGSISFTTGMFRWPNHLNTINDSHFVARDRMGRTMAFVAHTIKDGMTSNGMAWGIGVEEAGSSVYVDKLGLATLTGSSAHIVLGDHQPERAVSGQPLTFSNFKIWKLSSGQTFDLRNRPTCGYYLRSVNNGATDSNLYNGTPVTNCTEPPPGGSTYAEVETNDSRSAANDISNLTFPAAVTGDLKNSSDRDYFKFTLAAGQDLTISCAIPSAYDADIYLVSDTGSTPEASTNDGNGADESISFTPTASGTYYLDVEAYQSSGSSDYSCNVTK